MIYYINIPLIRAFSQRTYSIASATKFGTEETNKINAHNVCFLEMFAKDTVSNWTDVRYQLSRIPRVNTYP